MGELSQKEDKWLEKATEAAVAGARKIALDCPGLPIMTPVGRLNDTQWGWIITAAIFGWVQTRVEQAISEGVDQEQMVRMTGLSPSPCDAAVVSSILPTLADQAGIDWKAPLASWSKEQMTSFLLLAWRLINQAEIARDQGPGILRKSKADAVDNNVPFVP